MISIIKDKMISIIKDKIYYFKNLIKYYFRPHYYIIKFKNGTYIENFINVIYTEYTVNGNRINYIKSSTSEITATKFYTKKEIKYKLKELQSIKFYTIEYTIKFVKLYKKVKYDFYIEKKLFINNKEKLLDKFLDSYIETDPYRISNPIFNCTSRKEI